MNRKDILYLTILFIICSVVLTLRYAGIKGPDSDTTIFPLTALHLTQGKPFPFFFYGQDYNGTLPVLFMLILFETLGVSYILVEVFYALVIGGIVTLFSAFLLREINFFGVTVFVGTFLLFPHGDAVSIVGLKSGMHLFSVFLALISGYLFCIYVDKIIGENKHKTLIELFLPTSIFIVLAGLTYWSSKLGFLYLTTIFLVGLLGCRKSLVTIFSKNNPRAKTLIPNPFKSFYISFKIIILVLIIFASCYFMQLNPGGGYIQPKELLFSKNLSEDSWQNKIQENLIVSEILVVKKIDTYELDWVDFIAVVKKGFQRIKRNIFHVCKLYLYLFSNIIQPLNFLLAILPILFGGYFYFSKRIEFFSLIKGNWKKIEFKWVIFFIPILNILASLPTRFLANQDVSYIRYFISMNLAVLAVVPLFFSLVQSTKLRNFSLTLYLLFALCSYFYSDPKHYRELMDVPYKIKFLKSRYPDQSRLSTSEEKLIKFLEEEQLFFGYANYWDAYRLTFLTHERFVISPRLGQRMRYKPYDQLVKISKHPFFLFRMNDGADQKVLQKIYAMENNSFRHKKFGNKLLVY